MKRILPLVAMIFSWAVNADVLYQNITYINCESCSSNTSFKNAAKNHYLELYPPSVYPSPETRYYVVFNPNSSVYKTVKMVKSTSVGSPYGDEMGGNEGVTVTVNAYLESNSPQTNSYFQSFQSSATEFSSVTYDVAVNGSYSPVSFAWNKIYLGSIQSNWNGVANFADNNRGEINNRVNSLTFNPFHYITAPLAVEVETADGYQVVLLSKNAHFTQPWEVYYATKNGNYYDEFGNIIVSASTLTSSMVCISTSYEEVCREVDDESQANGGAIKRDNDGGGQGSPPVGCPVGTPPERCTGTTRE